MLVFKDIDCLEQKLHLLKVNRQKLTDRFITKDNPDFFRDNLLFDSVDKGFELFLLQWKLHWIVEHINTFDDTINLKDCKNSNSIIADICKLFQFNYQIVEHVHHVEIKQILLEYVKNLESIGSIDFKSKKSLSNLLLDNEVLKKKINKIKKQERN